MKKLNFLLVASLMAFSLVACGASKNVSKKSASVSEQQQEVVPQESETQRKIRELKEQQELRRLEREMQLEELKAQQEINKEQTKLGLQESMMSGDQKIVKFCYEESLDKPGEYMAGIGVSSPKKYERDAKLEANQIAIHDIASRFMGVIKNGTEYYAQSGVTPSGKDMDESSLESMTMNIVEKAVNQYAVQVCYESVQDQNEKIRYYLAVHVITNTAVDEVANQLEKAGVLRDKKNFKQELLSGLDAEAQKKAAEQERTLQLLKELGE